MILKNTLPLGIILLTSLAACNLPQNETKKTTATSVEKPTQTAVVNNTDLEKFTTADAERYCKCLDGYTRFMNEHFWYEQKYDIDSDANTKAIENSVTVLKSCVNCIVETSNFASEDNKWNFVDNLDSKNEYNRLFEQKFRKLCGQSAEMFLGIIGKIEPTDRYGFSSEEPVKDK